MKIRFIVFLLINLLSISVIYATVTPIATIQENFNNFDNQVVTVEGIVTVGLYRFATAGSESYLQDDSGKGIRLNDISTAEYENNIVKGNKLNITGTISKNSAGYVVLSDFSSFTVIESNVERPYTELTILQSLDYNQWQCSFVKVSGILDISQFGGNRLILSDSQENEVYIQIANSTGIIIEDSDIGEQVSVYGIVKFLQDQTLIYPGYQEDVGLTLTKPIITEVSHTPVEPYQDQEITISAKVVDLDGTINDVKIMYKADFQSEFSESLMTLADETNQIYTGVMPAYQSHTNQLGDYQYKIFAEDNADNNSESNLRTINVLERPIVTPIMDIYENFADYNNQSVIIEGVMTIGAGTIRTDILTAYIQDESEKGIQVFMPSASPHIESLARGNKVLMTGTIGEYNGVKQISDITYEVLEIAEMPYIEMTMGEAADFQRWESTYVKVSGTIAEMPSYAGGGTNITIKDETGSSLLVRVWDTTGIIVANLKTNIPLDVYGVVSVYNSRSQLIVGDQRDFDILLDVPQIEEVSFTPTKAFIDEEILVKANIIDYNSKTDSVYIEYRTNYEEDFLPERKAKMSIVATEDFFYEYTLPAFNEICDDEGEYLVRLTVYYDTTKVLIGPVSKVDVIKRRPVIENIRFMNSPDVNDTLIVRSKIYDTDGEISQAKIFYSLDYHQELFEIDMDEVFVDSTQTYNIYEFEGLIPGQKSGTMVYVSIWAQDDSLLTAMQNLDEEGNEIRFVYPVLDMRAMLRVPPKVTDIYSGNKVEIGYFAKTGDKVIVRIYNSEGKLMVTPVNKIVDTPEGINFYYWNGRDKDYRLVEPGLYICHLEVQDRENGKKKSNKAPIVIGTKLK
jgi:hypothetical protein